MKRTILYTIALSFATTVQAQKLHVTVFGGFANYQGDLQDKRFTLNQSGAAFGAGLLYEINEKLYARANVTFGKISGNDKNNAKNAVRNLSFSSPISDIHLGLEYNFFSLYERDFTPYVFAGVSNFSFKPSALDSAGNKVFLQPLSTEGQGFYQNRKPYKLNQFAIPFGGGVKFAFSDNFRIAVEVGLRKTNTDYLDDVSTTFVDENLLLANRGAKAVDLAFRGDELKSGLSYPADGAQRGGEKFKDWYYFGGINLAIRLRGSGNGGSKGGGKYKTGCPTRVL
jgi:opacity protein-like surface antigen